MIRLCRLAGGLVLLALGTSTASWAQEHVDLRGAVEAAQDIPRERSPQEPLYVVHLANADDTVDTVSLRLLDPATLEPITSDGHAICNPCGYVLKPGEDAQIDLDALLEPILRGADRDVGVLGWFSARRQTRITLVCATTAPLEPLLVNAPREVNRRMEVVYPSRR